MKVGDKPLWVLLVGFLCWEIYASRVAHDRTSHTMSDDLWRLQQRHPGTRVGIGAFLGGLAAHLLIPPLKIPGEDNAS